MRERVRRMSRESWRGGLSANVLTKIGLFVVQRSRRALNAHKLVARLPPSHSFRRAELNSGGGGMDNPPRQTLSGHLICELLRHASLENAATLVVARSRCCGLERQRRTEIHTSTVGKA